MVPFPASNPIPAALFDYDGTILREDSAVLLFRHALGRHPRLLARAAQVAAVAGGWAIGLVGREAVKLTVLRAMDVVPASEREEFLRKFHEEALAPRYLTPARERLDWHRARGHRLILVSASVDLYLVHAARHLQIDELVCTRAELSPRVRFLGPNCRGEEKVRRLDERESSQAIAWAESWAYSDSYSDLPLLRRCGHPVAVNPGRALEREAARNGWMMLKW